MDFASKCSLRRMDEEEQKCTETGNVHSNVMAVLNHSLKTNITLL